MAQEKDTTSARAPTSGSTDPGIYIGRILNPIDGKRMGEMRVQLLSSGKSGTTGGTNVEAINAIPLLPIGGQLPASGLSKNDQYDYNQQSYGLWGIPPDFGGFCIVLVTEGGDGKAFIVGYFQDEMMNANMFNNLEAEYNKKIRPPATFDPDTNERQLNNMSPFKGSGTYADRVKLEKVNGLWADPDRGPQTSGPRRDAIPMVQGWSSPGPYKYDGPKLNRTPEDIGQVIAELPFSRLGGTNIVFDDGNPGLYRTTLAKDGKREYVPAPGGERTVPHSEQFRIETRTGHKIILHNSEDFITIIHSNGDSWMEFTANGKIDVYSRGGISMGTEMDEKASINFHAHQFNVEVNEFNISAKNEINIEQRPDPGAEPTFALRIKDGRFDIQSTKGIDIENKQGDVTGPTDFKLQFDPAAGAFNFNPNAQTQMNVAGQNFAITGNMAIGGGLEADTDNLLPIGEIPSTQQMQYSELPMVKDLPESISLIDDEKTSYGDYSTMKSVLGRVPRKHPWRHQENLDPEQYKPEKILFGGPAPKDSEPVYAKSSISDTGIAAKKVHEERGGY